MSLLKMSNFRENEEIMQQTQIHQKQTFWYFWEIKHQSRSEFGTLGAVWINISQLLQKPQYLIIQ